MTVTVELPATVGVPETTQAERVSPAGRVPPEIEQLYGVVPPAAVIVELYATPTVPLGRMLVIESGELIVMEAGAVAVAPRLSLTWIVKFEVPFVVGTPEITPVLAEMLRPAGSDPAEMLHV